MDTQIEKDLASLRKGLRPSTAPAGESALPLERKTSGKTVKKKAKAAGAATGVKKATVPKGPSLGVKTGTKTTAFSKGKAAPGAKKEADPLAMAKAEIASLNKELDKEQSKSDARVENLTKEANARMDEYECEIMRFEKDLKEKVRLIKDIENERDMRYQKYDLQIRDIEIARDKRYQEYDQFLADGENERAELHNALIELKGNIRVFARVRPVLTGERKTRVADWIDHFKFPEGTDHRGLDVVEIPGHKSVMGKEEQSKKMPFKFDKVFDPASSQEKVFGDISLLVQSALDGYKVCLFAYGQTGSGKTYTMEGPDPGVNSAQSGMIPRAVRQIFDNCSRKSRQSGFKYKLFCSFVQIYNEAIRDLMNPQEFYEAGPGKQEVKHEIRNTAEESIITNIKEEEVTSADSVFKLLQKAHDNRKTSATKCNEVSSRSHSIFIMKIKGWNDATQQEMTGQLNLIDLAGSERLSKSQAEGDRLKETQHINKSLSCLGDVIVALGKGASSVPFRQSKLTHILQPSMTNQSKLLMFVNINPVPESLNESIVSLRFAAKVNDCEIGIAKKKISSK